MVLIYTVLILCISMINYGNVDKKIRELDANEYNAVKSDRWIKAHKTNEANNKLEQ